MPPVERAGRSLPNLEFEADLWAQGCRLAAGADEAGRGALAGPVTAAAVILPADPAVAAQLSGVNDSKQMTPAARRTWAEHIRRLALGWAVGWAGPDEIDAVGILPATRLALRRALEALRPAPEHLLLDYLPHPEFGLPCTPLVKGDARCLSIAAASVLAKTARDARMEQLDGQHPGYGLAAHKGYGTLAHRRALQALGPSPIHRRSFTYTIPDPPTEEKETA